MFWQCEGKYDPGMAATGDERQLLIELREIAKRGLDDPAHLIDLDGLLQLPSVSHTAEFSDSQNAPVAMHRCVALASVLTAILSELSLSEEGPRPSVVGRAEVIAGLFMLSSKWKGRTITNRRETLAGLEPGDDTSAFRRSVEEPLYRLVLSHLSHRPAGAVHQQSSPSEVLTNIVRRAAVRVLLIPDTVIFAEQQVRKYPPTHIGRCEAEFLALDSIVMAYESCTECRRNMPKPPSRGGVLPPDTYQSWFFFFSPIRKLFPPWEVLPLCERELSSCLAEFRRGEGPLRDYLDEHSRGKHITEKWQDWLQGVSTYGNAATLIAGCLDVTEVLLADPRFSGELMVHAAEETQQRSIAYLLDKDSNKV